MARLRVSRKARSELDSIWFYIARQSGSTEIASCIIDGITGRFWLFSRYPNVGRPRDDLRPGLRSSVAGDYVIIYRVEKDTVIIDHILHGSRDISGLLG